MPFLPLVSLDAWKLEEGISRNFLATLLRGWVKYDVELVVVEEEACGSGVVTGVSSRLRLRPRKP